MIMFGKNKVVKVEKSQQLFIPIQEIFETIQGEGPFSGERAVFVRFAECSLRCTWCDTDFESKSHPMSVVDIVRVIQKYNSKLVVITGGEPLLRDRLAELCSVLEDLRYVVQVETSGSVCSESFLDYLREEGTQVHIVCSPKTSKIVEGLIPFIEFYKYVIIANETGDDGLPVYSTQSPGKKTVLYRPKDLIGKLIYVSPCDSHDEEKSKANLQEAINSVMKNGYRLSLQVHKIINMP